LVLLAAGGCADTSLVRPPEGAPLLFEATAKGTVRYECTGQEGAVWQAGPVEETLFDKQGRPIAEMRSGAGCAYCMRWQATDGSAVVAQSIAREPGKRTGNVDAQLWAVRNHEGSGLFGSVETLRRTQGEGGEPVPHDCARIGTYMRLSYSAHYQFYGAGDFR
jgi:hypothetical protein